MTVPTWRDPYQAAAPVLSLAADWAAKDESQRAVLGLVLDQLTQRGDWRISICRSPQVLRGVSVVLSGGEWFLDAVDEEAAFLLAEMAVVNRRIPISLTSSESVNEWLTSALQNTGRVARRSKDIIMRCQGAKNAGEGEWAAPRHIHALEKFADAIRQKGHYAHPRYHLLVAFQKLALLQDNGSVTAVVERFGRTASYAGIGRVHGLTPNAESSLLTFAVNRLLSERPAVQTIVNEEDRQYRDALESIGFEPAGTLCRTEFLQ